MMLAPTISMATEIKISEQTLVKFEEIYPLPLKLR